MVQPEKENVLQRLVGKSLTAVMFFSDYVDFLFNDLVLSSLSWPMVVDSEGRVARPGPGYRDALCAQIGKLVQSAEDAPEHLQVLFDDGSRIVIPLETVEIPGQEGATLSGKGQFFRAWLLHGSSKL